MKKALIISITFNLIIVLFFGAKRFYYSYAAAPLDTSPYDRLNAARSSLLNSMKIDSTDIVFVGNSLTEGFPVTELFGPHVKNRGISGNTTWHLLNRIDNIAAGHPKKIFIEIGINDFNFGSTVDSAFTNYKKIIAAIQSISPRTRVYIQSLTPTCMSYAGLFYKSKALNDRLQFFCRTQNLTYVDIYSPFLKGSQMDSAFTYDGIHLNGRGYEVWGKAIEKYIH